MCKTSVDLKADARWFTHFKWYFSHLSVHNFELFQGLTFCVSFYPCLPAQPCFAFPPRITWFPIQPLSHSFTTLSALQQLARTLPSHCQPCLCPNLDQQTLTLFKQFLKPLPTVSHSFLGSLLPLLLLALTQTFGSPKVCGPTWPPRRNDEKLWSPPAFKLPIPFLGPSSAN